MILCSAHKLDGYHFAPLKATLKARQDRNVEREKRFLPVAERPFGPKCGASSSAHVQMKKQDKPMNPNTKECQRAVSTNVASCTRVLSTTHVNISCERQESTTL